MPPRTQRRSSVYIRPASLTRVLFNPTRLPKKSARELFAELRPLVLGSRPVEMVPHKHFKDAKGKPLKVAVYGAPTYRNVKD